MENRTGSIPLEVEQEIKLQINEHLYTAGHLTTEMYERAKVLILKSTYSSAVKDAS